MAETWDWIVIGGGPGGYVAAIRGAQLGFSVLCVEKRATLGGVCLNQGCIPSKALLAASLQYAQLASGEPVPGVRFSGVSLDLPAMLAAKDEVVTGLTRGVEGLFKKYGVKRLQGKAVVEVPGRVRVTLPSGESVHHAARNILLAMGGRPVALPGLPFDGQRVVTSTEALAFPEVPRHLLVVGGGAIGLEIGSIWRRLGARVTVVEAEGEILPGWDATLVRHAVRLLRKQGFVFHTGFRATASSMGEGEVRLGGHDREGREVTLAGDRLLVAVGRRPNSDMAAELGLVLEKGRVRVDGDFATSLPGIFAVGDLIPGPMLAHKAMEEGVMVMERAAGMVGAHPSGVIPQVIYTHPEMAMAGLTETAAKEAGHVVRTGQFSFLANGRARASRESDGVVKLVAEGESGRLLGVHLLGPAAAELIAVAVPALEEGWRGERLARMVFPHPGYGEALKEAALALSGNALHA